MQLHTLSNYGLNYEPHYHMSKAKTKWPRYNIGNVMSETSQNGKQETDVDHRAECFGRFNELRISTNLSDREAWVVALWELGLTHAEIADVLDVAKGTVDSHNHRALVKYQMAYHTKRELEDMYETPGDTHTDEDLEATYGWEKDYESQTE